MMPTIDRLTPDQASHLAAWAERWCAIGWRTGPASRDRFERAARRCYAYAGVPWPGRLIWVSSPLELALAGPVAALVLRLQALDRLDDPLRLDITRTTVDALGAVTGVAPWGQMHPTLAATLDGATGGGLEIDPVGVGQRDFVRISDVRDAALAGVLHDSVGQRVIDAARLPLALALRQTLPDDVADVLRLALGERVAAATGRATTCRADDDRAPTHGGPPGAALQESVRMAIRRGACGALRSGSALWRADIMVRETVAQAIRVVWREHGEGQFACGGPGASPVVSSFLREVCGLRLPDDLWDRARALEEIAESVAWWYPHREFVLACGHPAMIHREPTPALVRQSAHAHQLHYPSGPAMAWSDGWGVHALHGKLIPFWQRHVLEAPSRITAIEILAEEDPQMVRLMLDRHGHRPFFEALAGAP